MLRRPVPVRRLAAAAVLPLALTTLAACGSDDGSTAKDASAGSSTSATPTEDATEDSAASEAPAAGDDVEPAAFMDIFDTAFDQATTAHVSMEMTTAMGAMTAQGDADYTATPPEMSMTMSGDALPGEGMQLIMADGTIFMKMAAMGPKWMKIDTSDPSNPFGAITGQLDPQAMVDQFGDNLDSVTHEGEQEIDGETVDSYLVRVDSAAMLDSLGQAGAGASAGLPKTLDYTMSFTEDGLFRQMKISMGQTLGDVTMDFTDWGTDVSIEAPPADQVTDFDMGALMGGATTSAS